MLGLNKDIEAELGIDSINRVEILHAFRKELPPELATVLEGDMELLSQSKTFSSIVERIDLLARGVREGAENPAITVSKHDATGEQSLVNIVLAAVGEISGYPAETLSLDQDLEADLGIDPFQRSDILELLSRRLTIKLREPLIRQSEVLSHLKTVRAILRVLTEEVTTAEPSVAKAAPALRPISHEVESSSGCPRFVMRAVPQQAPPNPCRELKGLFVVTRDSLGVADLFCKRLSGLGATPIQFGPEHLQNGISEAVARARDEHGPVIGIAHLSAMQPRSTLPTTLFEWRQSNMIGVKALFELVKACHSDLATNEGASLRRVLAASMMGGLFGRGNGSDYPDPSAGACLGFLKTLETEVASLVAKMVDLDPDLSPERICELLIEELLRTGGSLEVGFPNGERTVFEVTQCQGGGPGEVSAGCLPYDAVILAIGGASGITAEILKCIARPGMRLFLVGRSPTVLENSETIGLKTPEDLRTHFVAEARRGGEYQSLAAIQRRMAEILRARERRANLTAFRAKGCAVEYVSADMREESTVRALLDRIYSETGRIDAVFHAAGLNADKLIAEKTRASFDEVFDTKSDSTYLLTRYLRPESLKLLVFFASTAGRFGNTGQSDYAAGNELLNRMAWYVKKHWPSCRSVAVNWGPWATTGMASEAVNRRFSKRGVIPISTEAGCDFMSNEIVGGRHGDVEVIAGDGPWNRDQHGSLDRLFDIGRMFLPLTQTSTAVTIIEEV
jgi:NAD(P)-dependent dehydrogenase (short-subunit alcohol dehydrogenase family)